MRYVFLIFLLIAGARFSLAWESNEEIARKQFEAGDLKGALAALDKVDHTRWKLWNDWYNYALVLQKNSKHSDARAAFERAYEFARSAGTTPAVRLQGIKLDVANSCFFSQDFVAAEKHFRELRADPALDELIAEKVTKALDRLEKKKIRDADLAQNHMRDGSFQRAAQQLVGKNESEIAAAVEKLRDAQDLSGAKAKAKLEKEIEQKEQELREAEKREAEFKNHFADADNWDLANLYQMSSDNDYEFHSRNWHDVLKHNFDSARVGAKTVNVDFRTDQPFTILVDQALEIYSAKDFWDGHNNSHYMMEVKTYDAKSVHITAKARGPGRMLLKYPQGYIIDAKSIRMRERGKGFPNTLKYDLKTGLFYLELTTNDEISLAYIAHETPFYNIWLGTRDIGEALIPERVIQNLKALLKGDENIAQQAHVVEEYFKRTGVYTSGDPAIEEYIQERIAKGKTRLDALWEIFLGDKSLPDKLRGKGLDCGDYSTLAVMVLRQFSIRSRVVLGTKSDNGTFHSDRNMGHAAAVFYNPASEKYELLDPTPDVHVSRPAPPPPPNAEDLRQQLKELRRQLDFTEKKNLTKPKEEKSEPKKEAVRPTPTTIGRRDALSGAALAENLRFEKDAPDGSLFLWQDQIAIENWPYYLHSFDVTERVRNNLDKIEELLRVSQDNPDKYNYFLALKEKTIRDLVDFIVESASHLDPNDPKKPGNLAQYVHIYDLTALVYEFEPTLPSDLSEKLVPVLGASQYGFGFEEHYASMPVAQTPDFALYFSGKQLYLFDLNTRRLKSLGLINVNIVPDKVVAGQMSHDLRSFAFGLCDTADSCLLVSHRGVKAFPRGANILHIGIVDDTGDVVTLIALDKKVTLSVGEKSRTFDKLVRLEKSPRSGNFTYMKLETKGVTTELLNGDEVKPKKIQIFGAHVVLLEKDGEVGLDRLKPIAANVKDFLIEPKGNELKIKMLFADGSVRIFDTEKGDFISSQENKPLDQFGPGDPSCVTIMHDNTIDFIQTPFEIDLIHVEGGKPRFPLERVSRHVAKYVGADNKVVWMVLSLEKKENTEGKLAVVPDDVAQELIDADKREAGGAGVNVAMLPDADKLPIPEPENNTMFTIESRFGFTTVSEAGQRKLRMRGTYKDFLASTSLTSVMWSVDPNSYDDEKNRYYRYGSLKLLNPLEGAEPANAIPLKLEEGDATAYFAAPNSLITSHAWRMNGNAVNIHVEEDKDFKERAESIYKREISGNTSLTSDLSFIIRNTYARSDSEKLEEFTKFRKLLATAPELIPLLPLTRKEKAWAIQEFFLSGERVRWDTNKFRLLVERSLDEALGGDVFDLLPKHLLPLFEDDAAKSNWHEWIDYTEAMRLGSGSPIH